MPARPGAGDQQHVGVPRAGGEEDPQPVDVVDRAEQRLDLPLLAAVGPGVHVPDVHAAAQRRGPRGQRGADRRHRLVGLGDLRDDQRLPGRAPPRRVRSRPRTRRTGPAARPRSARTGCTAPGRRAPGRPAARDRPGRAQRRRRPAASAPPRQHRRPGRARSRRTRRAAAASGSSPPRRAARAAPRWLIYSAAPAAERPKLASMNGKSVRMSPAKTSCISTRLWNDAERGWQRVIRPSRDRHVVEHLALRGLGPADGPAVAGLAGDAGGVSRARSAKLVGGLPDQTESLGRSPPTAPAAGPARRRPNARRPARRPAPGSRRRGGRAGRRRRSPTPCRSGRARRARGPAPACSGPVPRSRSRNEDVPISAATSAVTCFSSAAELGEDLGRASPRKRR